MNLTELIHKVSKDERTRELRLRQDEVKIITLVILDHIGKSLLEYGSLKLRGLFTLEIRKIRGRRIANPQTGEEMYSSDSHRIGVIPSNDMKLKLKEYKQ